MPWMALPRDHYSCLWLLPYCSSYYLGLNTASLAQSPLFRIVLSSTEFIRRLLYIENTSLFLLPYALVLQHSAIDPCILALNLQHWFRSHGFNHEMVIAVWAVLIRLFELLCVFAEGLFALLAGEDLWTSLEEPLGWRSKDGPFQSFGQGDGSQSHGDTRRSQTIFDL